MYCDIKMFSGTLPFRKPGNLISLATFFLAILKSSLISSHLALIASS